MAIFKCKMCGGSLEVPEGASSCTCDFCGTQQTIPTVKDEDLQMLFNRANVLRMKSEFDKAAEIYEKILQRRDTEAEAYWGLILCKYGIEYVEDPKTFKRIPTCHRASYDAVTSDEDYKNAVKYADAIQKNIYEQQAKEIDKIQKGIIALAQKEDPYDVFICYKETDENGKRTQDSVIANDIYYQLTREGFKVFYAAITLEDKLGMQYEPYIFSALNTAKVMLALGTKPEYFNAVWVKNEWSRFLKIMRKDRSKMLIPCYRDMDPYELPEEFAHLQAQDMGRIGFINDLVRGIKKVIVKETDKPKTQDTIADYQNKGRSNTDVQIKRGNMALEDHEWDKADSFFEEALNLDPESAEGYIGKLLARDKQPDFSSWTIMQKEKYSSTATERLSACSPNTSYIEEKVNEYAIYGYLHADAVRRQYQYDFGYDSALYCRQSQKTAQQNELASDRLLARAKQYAQGAAKKQIEDGLAEITGVLDKRIAQAQEQDEACIAAIKAAYEAHLVQADKKAKELNLDAQNRREQRYQDALILMDSACDVPAYGKAIDALNAMNGYRDSYELAEKCREEIGRIEEEKRQKVKKAARKKTAVKIILIVAAAICIAATIVVVTVIIPGKNYNAAVALMDNGDYIGAYEALGSLNGYKDSAKLRESIKSDYKAALLNKASVGESVYFGTYEQGNNKSKRKEDIEWIVLARDGNQILVTSKYALDCKQYNTSRTDVTWESCSLREWLNSTFLNEAFTETEQACIPTVTVTADKNPVSNTDAGNDTQDKVFLLSIQEAEKYFSSNSERQCASTEYAKAQGANTSDKHKTEDGKAACQWWLRSPGYSSDYAAYVNIGGSVVYFGVVNGDDYCVRPALWIDLGY